MNKKRKRRRVSVCRVCGCTDDHACPQGCAWADKDHTLCTACADVAEKIGV